MATKQQELDVTTVNKVTTQGITRIVEVRLYDDSNVSINLTTWGTEDAENCKAIKLSRRETLSLIFFLVSKLLPYKFLVNRNGKRGEKEKRERKEENLIV